MDFTGIDGAPMIFGRHGWMEIGTHWKERFLQNFAGMCMSVNHLTFRGGGGYTVRWTMGLMLCLWSGQLWMSAGSCGYTAILSAGIW